MAVNYLQDYLGIDPNDYSAMEQGIAGISPLAPGQSIIPQAPVMPRASIMDEGDFASATAPLMNRVYGREQAAREKSESLSNELQALQEEMAQTSEAEIQKRADLERQIQNIMQERDTSRTSAEDLANQLQGLQSNLQEVTQLRDTALQDYQNAVAQQDIIRQQAAENQAIQLEEQRNSLLEEREGIITTLEQDFGVQRSELESVIGGLEGQVGDLTSKVGELESVRGSLEGQINDLSSQMQNLETEKQDALAQQDIIRAESAQAQQDALAQQGEQFATEKSALEQQIADLTAQVGQQPPGGGQETGGGQGPIGEEGPPLNYMEFIESGRTPAEYNQYMKDYIARTMPDAFPDLSGLQNVTDETRQLVQDSLASGDPILAPDRIQDMIDKMGGQTVPPKAPQVPPREKLIPPNMLPPKRDDQIFIDDRPRDPRLDRERGVPIGGYVPGGGGIDYGGPQQPIPLIPGSGSGVPAIKDPNEAPLKFRPIQKPIRPKPIPISIGGAGGGTYKEFEGPDGRVLGVGVRPPSFSTNPNRKGQLVDKISSGLGTIGIASQPLIPSQQTTTKKQYMKPPSIGGVGGMSGKRSMRPMMRAGGGAIGQAIADLQNRLR